jgi:hypothetical protein
MTTIKLLSAGAIAAAILATPVMARDNYLAKRHVAGKGVPVPPDGKNCDVGDDASYAEGRYCSQTLQGRSGASRTKLRWVCIGFVSRLSHPLPIKQSADTLVLPQ